MSDYAEEVREINLAILPPDNIRAIIPMVGDPLESEITLISRAWYILSRQYLNKRFRPIYGMTIYSGDFRFDVWIIVNDAEHFAIRKRKTFSYFRKDTAETILFTEIFYGKFWKRIMDSCESIKSIPVENSTWESPFGIMARVRTCQNHQSENKGNTEEQQWNRELGNAVTNLAKKMKATEAIVNGKNIALK